MDSYEIQQTLETPPPMVSEFYENALPEEDLIENVDYGLDSIPENEFENYEEEYSLSEHFEINEDELIYPLPYNDWIEQSFELKEYGIETAFSESGTDIHRLGLTSDIHDLQLSNEEYDDEDIQRAIDFNINNFEEEGENNADNVVTTESFKTLSNDVSPHLKQSDKEFDSWSTADAPSIEEDLGEHDNIISKIDELLAEDFDDLDRYEADSSLDHEDIHDLDRYEADSPLDHEDIDDYFSQVLSTPDNLQSKEFIETENDIMVEDTLLQIDKHSEIAGSETLSKGTTLEKETKPYESESVSSKLSVKATSELSESLSAGVTLEKSVVLQKDQNLESTTCDIFLKTDTELVPEAVTLKKDSKVFEFVSEKITVKTDSEFSESVSSEITVIKDTKSSEVETASKDGTLKKDSKTCESKSASDFLKKDSKAIESKSVSDTLTKDSKASESKSTSDSLKRDFDEYESKSVSKKVTSEKDTILSESKSTSVILTKDSEISESNSASDTVKKDSKISESKSALEKAAVEKSFKLSEAKSISDTLVKDSKASESKSTSDTLEKDSMVSESKSSSATLEKDSKISESKSTSEEVALEKDSKLFESGTIVRKKSIKKDSKTLDSESVSCEVSIKSLAEESDNATVVLSTDGTNLGQSKTSKSTSEEALSLVLPSGDDMKKVEATQSIPQKDVQTSSIKTDVSVKLKSSKEKSANGKDFSSTSDETSASVILPQKDSESKISDQLTYSSTSSSQIDSSSDIPSKLTLAKSDDSIKKTVEKLSEATETMQSSHLIRESSVSTSVSESNIPIQEHKAKTVGEKEKSVGDLSSVASKDKASTDSFTKEVKPDIPKKTKRKSLDLKEELPVKQESDRKPSLPPKLSKRHSSSESSSSSRSDSLSSSSSVESIGSFESAPSRRRSRQGSLKTSEESSYHSESPDVPARRSRSSRLSSSSRSRSKDNEDSSTSSSLRIRRRSSNFIEPEPIDLSKKRASIDERMLKLQKEGKCVNKEKAFIAAKLIEMQFEEEDALLASRQCNSVYHAVKFLTQLCELCNCRFPVNLMASMVHCTHRTCKECLKAHFTSLIYDRSIFTLLCPICQKPDITDQNIQEYFNHLDMMLRNILDERVYDLFQRKLRDEVLTKDPNFHWCSQCSSGFIASPRLKKLYCPDCSAITCALCHQTWELEHEGVHCERFQQWKDMHTPEPPPAGLVKFLTDRGISCPSCGIVYAQACGGCMMYKCSHCSFEFCGFCIQPLKRGRDCSNEICDSRGVHIHHLHNCLFFIRDKDITEIQILLEEESVTYLTIPPKDQIVKSRCQVREQKHSHGALIEDRCGRNIEPYCAGLCQTHYYEYLAELLRKNNISPLSIMTIQDLQFILRKSRILVPERIKGEISEDYYERLLKLIMSALT